LVSDFDHVTARDHLSPRLAPPALTSNCHALLPTESTRASLISHYTTSMPMLRAVPSTVRMADSIGSVLSHQLGLGDREPGRA
jgi:hypothetical protein